MRSRSSCEDKPCVTGDRFVAGFAHQVTADADAEVEAFNAYAEWCKDQAQDDGHQQETLDASIASTNAAIENFAAKAERKEAKDFSESEAELLDVVDTLHCILAEENRHMQFEQCCSSSHCSSRCGSFSSDDKQKLVALVQSRQSSDDEDGELSAPAERVGTSLEMKQVNDWLNLE